MQFIKILFLGIAIFFSFGFTTYQSTCGKQVIKIEESAHSCCHSKKKTECTQSKDCKADCCLQPSDFFVLSQFVIDSEELEKLTVIELIKNLNKSFHSEQINIVERIEIQNNYTYISRKLSGKQILSLKQSWLI